MNAPASSLWRRIGAWAAVLCACVLGGSRLDVQAATSDPVTIVVPAGPGSGPDVNARRLAPEVAARLGRPVIVENRAGAAGIIGTQVAARAAGDGRTVYLGTNAALCINPALYRRLPYDAARDFEPISMATRGSPVVLVGADQPFTSLAELVRQAKSHPGQLAYASAGVGSTSHLTMEWFKHQAGLDLLHVPYKDEATSIGDVAAGRVQVTIAFGAVAVGQVRSGRLRALAVAGARRNPLLPDVPTAAEQGFPDFVVSGWIGFFVPAATPPDVRATLERAFVGAERSADYADWITALGSEPVALSATLFADELRRECPKWAEMVSRTGIKLDP